MSIVNNAAYEIPNFYVGLIEANSDLSAEATYQFAPVDVIPATGTGLTGPAGLAVCADGAAMFGILQNNPILAEAGEVMCQGVSKALAGGTFTVGQLLMVSSGKLIVATAGNFAVAKALQAGAAGTIVSVYLDNYGKQ